MPKEKHVVPKESLTYEKRLKSWESGYCPYCHTKNITNRNTRFGIHYKCNNVEVCGAENNFTKKRIAKIQPM